MWRKRVEEPHPYEQKQEGTVRWLCEFDRYLGDLRDYLTYVARRSEIFSQLPLNGDQRPPAEDCLRRLALQVQMLNSVRDEILRPVRHKAADDDVEQLQKTLRRSVDKNGVKHCVGQTKLSPDTINDFLNGQIRRPRRQTLERLRKYILEFSD